MHSRARRLEPEHRLAVLALVLSFVCAPATAETAAPERIVGFAPARVSGQLDLERRLDDGIDPAELLEWNATMTPRPHHAGSPQARANAEWLLERFREWGFEAEIETFHVLFPTPRVRELELVAPTRYRARLQEDVIPEDPTSELAVKTGLPPFNAYSADGDVTAELVYVNQGVPRDYEELERLGVDVRGKIVIARYGGSWRGIKPKVAAEKGAIGCLIYNDPHEDGYFEGETYPEGPYKHPAGVQRGSVLDLPARPGDPLTPMRGAVEGAARLERETAETILKIPVLPISWRDAQPLLEALEGPVAPDAWRGALPITYRVGPGPARVRLHVAFDWGLAPAYDVIARLPGAERPDEWIVRGNHHDAWVIGGRDPISGLIGLLGEAQAVGALAREGWRPKRTIVYAAWDAEEPGLLGSTEWAEQHAVELRQKAAVYINSDSNSRGFLSVGGSHALQRLVDEAASAVEDPQTGVSVAERLRAALAVRADAAERKRLLDGGELRIAALGSGSDYSPFLQHLGVASLNVGFGGEAGGGEYHTAFDSHEFFRRFVDPGAVYAAALARVAGRITLRLADADLLPFDYTSTHETIARYADEVRKLADQERESAELHNRLVERDGFRLAADPTETYVAPEAREEPPHLEWAPLLNALDRLGEAARSQREALAAATDGDDDPAAATAAEVDRILYSGERDLLNDRGLPRRPWFRHLVYAPGFYTGYGVKTLPGVREAIEERRYDEAQQQIRLVAERVEALAARLEQAAQVLGAAH
jgi:N-acetylated-alpha-linked acidic dipeptidase